MTASPVRQTLLLGLLAAVLATGCQSPAGAPPRSALLPSVGAAPPPPDVADWAAADLARAALLSNPEETTRQLARMRAIDAVLQATEDHPTGMMGAALDLRNTTLDDRRAYRAATRELLDHDKLDPAHRAQLEIFRDDDPLVLADKRIRDVWLIEFGRAFNALAEPVGKSIMTKELMPYRLGRSLIHYAAQVYTRETLLLQHRQALVHWKEFIERNPQAAEVEEILPKVKAMQGRWHKLQRNRALKVASRALDEDKVRLALVYADRALRHSPEDHGASELRERAAARLMRIRENQRRSLDAPADDPLAERPLESRELALALLEPAGDPAQAAARLLAAEPDGPLADEARFVQAMALGEAGDEQAMWDLLEELADGDPLDSNMTRHAAGLVRNPEINTYGAFHQARSSNRWGRFRWILFGPFYRGVPDRGLPGPLEWILDAPTVAQNVLGTPMRLINAPWAKALPSARVAAAYARRHLEKNPHGLGSEDARDWLEAYEKKRNNYVAALSLYEDRKDANLEELAELREQAAAQYLDAAFRERSVGMRLGMYNQVALTYPGSRAARIAGELAGREAREATAQHIRISRGFLEENPEVAGPRGLGLRPSLLDGDASNAELHPDGVVLVGARVIEVSYLAPSGDPDDEPRRVRERVSPEHLSRIVSQLEESSFRKMLLDPDEHVGADAQRDLYFERVRLGLADDVDQRPSAVSSYAYRGLREKYGMVRAREPILPFDLVVQGSIHDLSIGAFPRIRRPRETPDAILYR